MSSLVLNPFFVFINSRNRIDGTDSNFTYAINFPADLEFDRVVVLNALIPKSYYLIQSGDNTFQLQEGSSIVTITVPIGSYLLSTFKNTISSLLTAASPNGLTYTVTYPVNSAPDTGLWTYTQNNGSIVSSLIFNSTLYEPFGFLPSSTNVFSGTTLISTAVLKLQSEDRLLIHSNLTDNAGNDDVLVSINSTTSINYSSINYECQSPEFFSRILNSQHNNTYSFQLTDEDDKIVDLNGLNLNMTILFYKRDDIFERIKAFLKMAVLK